MKRYVRHTILKQIEQEKLTKAHIVIVGIGALGTVAAELLARAGIGKLTLIDRDVIELSNLQRQSLFCEEDVGKPKAIVAKEKLTKINSEINIHSRVTHLNTENVEELFSNVTLVLDCTDNIKTRFVMNDYCYKQNLPWIYAAAVEMKGSVAFISPEGPCLRCFLPQNAQGETCMQQGVLNTLTHTIASMQVTLALKFLVGEEVNNNELTYYTAWDNSIQKLKIHKKEACAHSGSIQNDATQQFCSGKYQLTGRKVNLQELKEKLEQTCKVECDNYTLKAGPILVFQDGRAIIKARSKKEAESIFSRLIGN